MPRLRFFFLGEVGIVYCTCGKCLLPTEKNQQMNKERFDVLSFPGYVITKNPSHGARHGPSMRQTMHFKARDMLRKARSNKNGICKTIVERWFKDEQHRKSLSDISWTEEQIEQNEALASEDHSYVATPEERSRFWNSWKISLNREGIQGPIKRRPGFREAKQKCIGLYNEHVEKLVKETVRSNLHSKPDIVINNSKAAISTITQLIIELDGDLTLQPDQQLRLRQRTGSSTMIGSRIKVGIQRGQRVQPCNQRGEH